MLLPSRLRSCMNVSAACCLSLVFLSFGGCSKPEFLPNELATAGFLQSTDPAEVVPLAEQAAQITEQLFGVPDEPKWPEEVPGFLRWEDVLRSAGPVGRAYDRVERGLYRKHCVQCHGVSGDGGGPAAMVLAPYARDFRRGTFKFKSTPLGFKPTRSDLVQIVERGIPGTSMPGFAPLRNREEFSQDIDAVTEYVIYLAIRGEVERLLLRNYALDGDELSLENGIAAARAVTTAWANADSAVPAPIAVASLDGEELQASIARGHELFKSDKTACYKCHGPDGHGDGVSHDYDEWTKDWTIRAGIDPSSKSEWRGMKRFGARKPVLDHSRNLSFGGLRGGATIEQIARRIQLGIDGTPMPSATIAHPSENAPPVGITVDEFCDLVRFVADKAGVAEQGQIGQGETEQGETEQGETGQGETEQVTK